MTVRSPYPLAAAVLVVLVLVSHVAAQSPPPPSWAPAGAPPYVWWEGEAAIATNFPGQSAFSPATLPETRHLLSGGDWLSSSGRRGAEDLFATYRVVVPAAGEYQLWTRKFWKHGPFRWRFGQGDWRTCGPDVALADDTYLRVHLGANWVHLGQTRLPKGEQTFELRLLAREGEEAVAAFDAFLLIQGPFMPNGQLKPGERSDKADPGFFPFEPPLDPFGSQAPLDLRSMNEAVAGEKGFVRREGDRLLLGDGRPVRFWGVNVGPNNIAQDRASIDYLARRLAKLGVNLVRCHGALFDPRSPDRADARALDRVFYLVAALKRQGIYTALSYYFPLWLDVRPEHGIGGFETIDNKKPFALIFFDPRLQSFHRAWTRALLTAPNPHTGRPLAQEPAVAMVEAVNEDSLFFWTFTKQNVPALHWQRLEGMFGDWLKRRFGSLDKALASWPRERLPVDDPAAGRVGLYEAYHMTAAGLRHGSPDKPKRVGEQVRFLTGLQRGFYEQTKRLIREELKSGSLVVASNWTVSDAATLDALERYTYTAGDVIDRHGYFGGKHAGDGASYSVRVGHTFESRAAVSVPEELPLQSFQVAGYPQVISEVGWTNPNRTRADATFLGAAYGALQGLDGITWFAVGSNFLRDGSMSKFPVSSPTVAGTFPAAALLYRRGDVREAGEVLRQALDLEELFAMKGSGASATALDALRARDVPPTAQPTGRIDGFDPLSFYVGRVARAFGERPDRSRQANLPAFIDRQRRVVRSQTGELAWDYGTGVVRLDTPKSQGAAGFLSRAGRIDLGSLALDCKNDYASLLVVSLDDRPLIESRKLLIQAMTEEQPYGFTVQGNRIASLGGAPLGVRRIQATVTLKSTGPSQPRVVALDENGYAARKGLRTHVSGGLLTVELAPDAIYHVVSRP